MPACVPACQSGFLSPFLPSVLRIENLRLVFLRQGVPNSSVPGPAMAGFMYLNFLAHTIGFIIIKSTSAELSSKSAIRNSGLSISGVYMRFDSTLLVSHCLLDSGFLLFLGLF